MTILHMDGLEKYTNGAALSPEYYVTDTSRVSFSTTGGRFGGRALIFTSGFDTAIRKTLASSQNTIWQAMSVYIPGGSAVNNTPFVFWNSGSAEITLAYNASTGKFRVNRGTFGGTTLATQATTTLTGWHWIEFGVFHANSGGWAEVWVDGVKVIDVTSVDTQNGATQGITEASIGPAAGMGHDMTSWIFDDWVVSTTRIGDHRIYTQAPTSDVSPNDGTQSTGATHYGVVDEIPPNSDTDYSTLANTSGLEEMFGIAALPSSPAPVSVTAVQVAALVRKDDAGTANGRTKALSNATTNNGTTEALSTTYGFVKHIMEVDPDTTSAWTVSAVNALKVGYEVQ